MTYILESMISDIKNTFDKVLYIGLRGSYSLGLNDENSDYDLYVVLVDSDKIKYKSLNGSQTDIYYTSFRGFISDLQKGRLESYEALFNEVYSVVDFSVLRNYICNNTLYQELFEYEIYKVLKNQQKQFINNKSIYRQSKFLAKSVLYYRLLTSNSQNILNCFIKHKVDDHIKQEYFNIKYSNNLDEYLDLFTDTLNYRNDSERRKYYKDKWSNYFSSIHRNVDLKNPGQIIHDNFRTIWPKR